MKPLPNEDLRKCWWQLLMTAQNLAWCPIPTQATHGISKSCTNHIYSLVPRIRGVTPAQLRPKQSAWQASSQKALTFAQQPVTARYTHGAVFSYICNIICFNEIPSAGQAHLPYSPHCQGKGRNKKKQNFQNQIA